MGLEDRLARYIELTWIDKGEPLTKDEVDAVVALTMVNNSGESWRSAEASNEAWRSPPSSEAWQPRRSARLASRETVNYAENDTEDTWQPRRSSRIAATTPTGSHPMVRRSQVTRR